MVKAVVTRTSCTGSNALDVRGYNNAHSYFHSSVIDNFLVDILP